eukprot:TRINITY_DN4138_c0_g1_i1.p1 TRINITY_DN4138_c0_g1~~TRINITY_DN4138_c0_g1_i1.p1  ORF type:complete len:654 (+),score=171.98 TRINITY_DN4138_c0_g1_i1:41-2002(+)
MWRFSSRRLSSGFAEARPNRFSAQRAVSAFRKYGEEKWRHFDEMQRVAQREKRSSTGSSSKTTSTRDKNPRFGGKSTRTGRREDTDPPKKSLKWKSTSRTPIKREAAAGGGGLKSPRSAASNASPSSKEGSKKKPTLLEKRSSALAKKTNSKREDLSRFKAAAQRVFLLKTDREDLVGRANSKKFRKGQTGDREANSAPVIKIKKRKVLQQITSWKEAGLYPEVIKALAEDMGLEKPIGIQGTAINWLLKGHSALLGDQCGSGKTLAFVLPLVQRLIELKKAEEARNSDWLTGVHPHSPEIVVLAPSKELAGQIYFVFQHVLSLPGFIDSHLRATYVGGGAPKGKQAKSMQFGVDIVVGTSARIIELTKEGRLSLGRTRTVVIDEADTMLETRSDEGRGFAEEVGWIHERCSRRKIPQTVLVSATLKQSRIKEMQKVFGGLKPILGGQLHKTAPTLRTNFVHVGGDQDRMLLLVNELKNLVRENCKKASQGQFSVSRTLVFCNTVQSARAVGHYLDENSVEHFCLHGKILPDLRKANLAGFLTNSNPSPVLVSTDVACRGLDFPDVNHVILFDFPPTLTDFLHRSGRTARAGRKGTVTAFVMKHDLNLAEQIRKAQREETAVPIDLEKARVDRNEQQEGEREDEQEESSDEDQ